MEKRTLAFQKIDRKLIDHLIMNVNNSSVDVGLEIRIVIYYPVENTHANTLDLQDINVENIVKDVKEIEIKVVSNNTDPEQNPI